jgi:hypothetical protein
MALTREMNRAPRRRSTAFRAVFLHSECDRGDKMRCQKSANARLSITVSIWCFVTWFELSEEETLSNSRR